MSNQKSAERSKLPPLIPDDQRLVGAKSRFGYPIKTYDEGWGQLFIMRDTMGIVCIVRANNWTDAYGICEDEFLPEADESLAEMEKTYATEYISGRELWLRETISDLVNNFKHSQKEAQEQAWDTWTGMSDEERSRIYARSGKEVPFSSAQGGFVEHPCWQESFGFRPNGPNQTDTIRHGIYAKDWNGDVLNELTPELAKSLEITLEIKNE
jgi:hypothetical protein